MTSSPHLRETLEQLGWRITLVQNGWWRCLIEEGGASWSGESATEQGAIEAAFARMVPSALARRELLAGWSESLTALPPEPEPVASAGEPERFEEPQQAEPGPVAEEPQSNSEPIPAEAAEAAEAPTRPAPPRLDLAEALDSLAQQKTELHEAFAELGELAPSRIRLVFLLWVARMRAVEQACPGESAVHAAGHAIANLIQEQAFALWPGQVPALQLSARPRDCRWLVYPEGEGPDLLHWSDVGDAASAALSQLDAEPGRDADGWADTLSLTPRPTDPNGILVEICRRMDHFASMWSDDERRVPSEQDLRDEDLCAALRDIAQRARWLRGGVSDARAWSGLIGHLRRIADRCRRDLPELSRLLDEAYRPQAGTWAKQLGQDPEAKRRKRARRALLQARPGKEVEPEVLRAWLLEAFEIFTNPDLAALLRRLADQVKAIEDTDMPDRRRRQRLTKLQTLMGETQDEVLQAALEAEASAADRRVDGAPPAASAPNPIEELRQRVLPVTRGKRLLFVSNRPDPHLEADIRTSLEPATLDWCVAENKRVDSAAEAIGRGSYDMVLCATGFLDHGTDKTLRTACRNAGGVPCLRVYKGRTLACLRAIERDLGLRREIMLSLGT